MAGHPLDEIQRMSPSELRTALRNERQERKERSDAQAKIVGRRDQEIERLQRNLDQSQEALDNAQSGRVKPDERANMLAVAVARLDTDADVWNPQRGGAVRGAAHAERRRPRVDAPRLGDVRRRGRQAVLSAPQPRFASGGAAGGGLRAADRQPAGRWNLGSAWSASS